jgi:phage shock protein C
MTAQIEGGQPAPRGGTSEAPPALHRSRADRVLAGVCGGIAETYGADPTAVRLLAAIIAIFTGIVPMLIVYLVAAVVIPESSDAADVADPARSRMEPGRAGLVFGVVLIVAGVVALANEVFRIDWELLWPAALIAFGGLIVLLTLRKERI